MTLLTPRHRRSLTLGLLSGITIALGVAAFCAFAGGCGLQERSSTLEQRQREKVDQSSASEFARSVEPQPFRVKIPQSGADPIEFESPSPGHTSGKNTNEELSDSKASGSGKNDEAFPLFVKLIGVGVGLAILGVVGWLLIRSSAAAKAAWNWFDEAIGARIKTIAAMKGASTDPIRIQALSDAETALHDLRAEAAK